MGSGMDGGAGTDLGPGGPGEGLDGGEDRGPDLGVGEQGGLMSGWGEQGDICPLCGFIRARAQDCGGHVRCPNLREA